MTVFVERLPDTKTEKHGAIEWLPIDSDTLPVAGLLTITGKRRKACTYRVEDFPCDFAGRGFCLVKTDGTGHYSCFVSGKGPGYDLCECAGSAATGACKHLAALRALLENGQL